jgi:hypothetical protein
MTQTIVSPSGTVYKAQAEAEAGMKTVKVRVLHVELK